MFIMYVSESSVLLSKTKDPAKGHRVDMIVVTICHLVHLILLLIIEVGGIKRCQDLLIPVIME
jgi:hypothetical protein